MKELSIPQMARRIIRYVPELDFNFVCSRLREYGGFGMSALDVCSWLRYFDSFVIDGKEVLFYDKE